MISKYEKTNGVKLLATVMVMAMVFAGVAVMLSDEGVDAATWNMDGEINSNQTISDNAVVVDDFDVITPTSGPATVLTIANGATMTVNENTNLTIGKGSYLVIMDTANVIVNGTITVETGAYLINLADEPGEDKGFYLNGSLVVKNKGTVTSDLTDVNKVLDSDISETGTERVISVGAKGSISASSSNSNPSVFAGQTIYMAAGASVAIDSQINDVTVQSYSTNDNYVYGQAVITGTEARSNLKFSVISERLSGVLLNETANSRINSLVLDIAGTIGTGSTVTVTTASSLEESTTLTYAEEDGKTDTEIPVIGTVTANNNLNVDGILTIGDSTTDKEITAVVSIGEGSTVNVNAGSSTEAGATLNVYGMVYVAGTINVDEVGTDAKLVKLDLKADNIAAYIVAQGNGKVVIDEYDPTAESFGNAPWGVNGVYYIIDNVFTLVSNVQAAIDAVTAENQNEISVWGWADDTFVIGQPFEFTADVTVPDTISVSFNGPVTVAEGVTVTISDGTSMDTDTTSNITVEGELIDYNMDDYTGNLTITADVRSSDADETYYLYTTLANAISTAVDGDTIQIYGENVDIEKNLTIPAGVTIDANTNTINVKQNVTLTIDGVLDLSGEDSAMTLATASENNKAGSVVLNNIIVVRDSASDLGITDGTVPGFYVTGTVEGYETKEFIMAPAVAAANSATLTDVAVDGDVSYSGDLTFTAGEDNEGTIIKIPATDKVSISKIIIDGYVVDIAQNAVFTGTVEATTTDGVSAVTFSKAGNYKVSVYLDESEETPVTSLQLGKATTNQGVTGSVTISAGSVELTDEFAYGADRNSILTVSSGATLVVSGTAVGLTINPSNEPTIDYSAIVIDGTLAMDGAKDFAAKTDGDSPVYKPITINGTMTVIDTLNIPKNVTVVVNGTLAVSEVEDEEGLLTVDGNLVIGTASETLGAGATVTGPIDIGDDNYITVYAGSSVETAKLNANDTTGESDAVSTEFYINGILYKTVYAIGERSLDSVMPASNTTIVGFKTEGIDTLGNWYADADLKNKITATGVKVGDEGYEAIYFNAPAQNGKVQYSVGSGISLYVDGIRVDTGSEPVDLSVGTHTVTATVNPGYAGEVTITFNGQVVTGGTFEVTPEMAATGASSVVLSATGNITVDTGASGSSDGMGLTEILLIILVVLIVVMAIMVALRLMRS